MGTADRCVCALQRILSGELKRWRERRGENPDKRQLILRRRRRTLGRTSGDWMDAAPECSCSSEDAACWDKKEVVVGHKSYRHICALNFWSDSPTHLHFSPPSFFHCHFCRQLEFRAEKGLWISEKGSRVIKCWSSGSKSRLNRRQHQQQQQKKKPGKKVKTQQQPNRNKVVMVIINTTT